jgi:hypothetical protein
MNAQELQTQVAAWQEQISQLRSTKQNRPKKRKKYNRAARLFWESPLPVVQLDRDTFSNTSEASVQQQMDKACDEEKLPHISVVITDESSYLIDFDNERAEQKFAEYVEKVSTKEISAITNNVMYTIK